MGGSVRPPLPCLKERSQVLESVLQGFMADTPRPFGMGKAWVKRWSPKVPKGKGSLVHALRVHPRSFGSCVGFAALKKPCDSMARFGSTISSRNDSARHAGCRSRCRFYAPLPHAIGRKSPTSTAMGQHATSPRMSMTNHPQTASHGRCTASGRTAFILL